LQRLRSPKNTFVVSTSSQRPFLDEQLPSLGGWMLEPAAENSAPCLMLALADLLKRGYSPDTGDAGASRRSPYCQYPTPSMPRSTLRLNRHAKKVRSSLLGIKPDHAHTGYGYIEAGEETGKGVHKV
jgi:mannose-1-phosphate guanylyltransferase